MDLKLGPLIEAKPTMQAKEYVYFWGQPEVDSMDHIFQVLGVMTLVSVVAILSWARLIKWWVV